tara:strand:- start:42 stop:302 length:261 start_codon:yes stop_codon:yes gene_type:complete
MNELYYIKPYGSLLRTLRLEFGKIRNTYLLRIIEGEITRNKGKSEFPPIEEVYYDKKGMLKKVSEMSKQLSGEKWNLKTKLKNTKH